MAKEKTTSLTYQALMERTRWKPLPAVAALVGDADFFKREIEDRFIAELSEGGEKPFVRRVSGADKDGAGLPLAEVLDDLRTPSFFESAKLVVIQAAEPFVARNAAALEPFISTGFSGGHLLLHLDNLDGRTRFAKNLAEKGWAVSCQKPFDRPPPWQPDADPWDNDLCRWVAGRARMKKVAMDLELAQAFCQRIGTDLATLDAEMEKLRTYLGGNGGRATLEAVEAVAGELREDSVFDLVDAFLSQNRPAALEIATRLMKSGYHPPRGSPIYDAGTIWSFFTGAVIGRLQNLRRAHALQARGQGPDTWIALKLTPKPFLPRFERDFRAASPQRIAQAFAALRRLDRQVKTGSRAQLCLEEFLLKY